MKPYTGVLPNEQALAMEASANPHAFEAIYNHYFGRIFTYIRYRVDDDNTADDLTAYVFERALSQINAYDPNRAPFAAWLFGIARNAVSNHHRRRRRWAFLPLIFAAEKPSEAPQPEDEVLADETQTRLLQVVAHLPERERDLIALKYVAGLNNRQIAHLTQLTESNVGVILHRALHKIRIQLEELAQ